MKKINLFLKNYIFILFLFFSYSAFSQFYFFGNSEDKISGFEYQGIYYDASPKGLKKFTNEVELTGNLKSDLIRQKNRIRRKKTVSSIALYGGAAIGLGIVTSQILKSENGEEVDTGTAMIGVGTLALGGIISWIVRPKKKDYFNFINTFNKAKKQSEIKVSLQIDYNRQMNYGLAIKF